MQKQFNSQFIQDIFIIDSENIYETQLVQQCFDMVGVFVAAVDLKGNITLINRKGRELLGYNEENIIGSNLIANFIDKQQRSETEALFNQLLNKERPIKDSTKFHFRTKHNQLKIIESKNITIRDKNNTVLGILISGEDVSGYLNYQRELQNDLNLYQILANNIPDINLFLFDENMQFIIAEGTEMKNIGLESSDFEKKHLSEIPNKPLRKIWEPLLKRSLEGEEIETEYKLNNYYYLLWVVPVKNQNKSSYSGVAITQNITDDKRTEHELKRSREEAIKANRAKSDFLARMSHEIRTPLNAILGFTEQLRQTELNGKQTEFLKIIDKSSEHLLALINDILILSKIESRKMSFDHSPFKVGQAIRYAYNTLLVKANEKNIRFTYDIDHRLDVVLLGDTFRLRQILINMLSNAIKFTSSGYVEMKCFMVDETDDEVRARFDIIDTGIGIKPENLQSIFEQFKQADSSITQKYGGTGLGLTICKKLIEMQDGTLSVSSRENVGTTFSFIIPYKKGKQTDIVPDTMGDINAVTLKGQHVLLVDDDSVNRLLGKTILEKFSCEFELANNGNEAIEKLSKNNYDIVLLDIHMPDISGIKVAEYLRNEMKNKSTKIVAVTAAVMQDDIKTYYKAGINDFLIKPFKEIHLFNKICKVLQINNEIYPERKEEIILKEEIHPRLYDLSELKKMSGNNTQMVVNMLATFIENTEDAVDKFEQMLAAENWKQIGETAHKVLPAYRHLNVGLVVDKLIEIKHKTLIDPDVESIPALVNVIVTYMRDIVKELKEEQEQLKSGRSSRK